MQREGGDLQGGSGLDRWLQELHMLGALCLLCVWSSQQDLAAFVIGGGCTPESAKWGEKDIIGEEAQKSN